MNKYSVYRVRLMNGVHKYVKAESIDNVVKPGTFMYEDTHGHRKQTYICTPDGHVVKDGWGSPIILIERIPIIQDCNLVIEPHKAKNYCDLERELQDTLDSFHTTVNELVSLMDTYRKEDEM